MSNVTPSSGCNNVDDLFKRKVPHIYLLSISGKRLLPQ